MLNEMYRARCVDLTQSFREVGNKQRAFREWRASGVLGRCVYVLRVIEDRPRCDACLKDLGVFHLRIVAHDNGADLAPWQVCSLDCLALLSERLRDTAFEDEALREFGDDA